MSAGVQQKSSFIAPMFGVQKEQKNEASKCLKIEDTTSSELISMIKTSVPKLKLASLSQSYESESPTITPSSAVTNYDDYYATIKVKGSVRGHKNRVAKAIGRLSNSSLETIDESNLTVYVTSLGIIRKTFHESQLIKFDERDIYLNKAYLFELRQRCNLLCKDVSLINNEPSIGRTLIVPSMFVNGTFLGGANTVHELNETGALKELLSDFRVSSTKSQLFLKAH
ncbi:Glutaredoxin domain-containing cysteine-rich protein, partial [Fragariocoptes setiger]